MSNADELLKLKELLDNNIITEEEFAKKKVELLSQNKNDNKVKNSSILKKDKKKEKNEVKISTLILAIIIIGIIIIFTNNTTKPPASYTNKKLLIDEYSLSQEEATKIIEIIDNCGYSNYYSDYKLEKGMDNDEIENSICFEIKSDGNIVGYIDIKDNAVYQIQYSDKILYQNGEIQHNLSEYLISYDEESLYITQTQEVIKNILQAPSTAKFPWDFDEYNIGKKDGSIIVQGYVDSQNGFGAMIRGTYQVTYTSNTVTSLIFNGEELIK